MFKLQLSIRRLGMAACGIVLGATLAACGHSNSTPPPAPSAVSQFISLVMSIISTADADTKEPDENAGNTTPATTETDEPVEVTL